MGSTEVGTFVSEPLRLADWLGLGLSVGEVEKWIPPAKLDPFAFSFAGAAPYPEVDSVLERVVQTGVDYWASVAEAFGFGVVGSLVREEVGDVGTAAVAVRHP